MGINRVKDHRGKTRIQVSKRWPDGSRFRRYFPNATVAKNTLTRIEAAIVQGVWQELKEELLHQQPEQVTVESFSKRFLDEHCKVRMKSWKRYDLSLGTLNAELGQIALEQFRRADLHRYVMKRSKKVKPNTVDRDIACIKKMFSFAVEVGAVDSHPLTRFPLLPVEEMAFQVMTVEEFRGLVGAMEEPALGAMVAVMGETAIRKGEALGLVWENVDLRNRRLTVEQTKSRRIRHIPLSEFAAESLSGSVRYLDSPFVFVNSHTKKPWVNPEKAFRDGRKAAGLDWVGFHDLRRFRISQWVMRGVDLRTVQMLAGHSDIKTTMKYAHLTPGHISHRLRDAEAAEVADLEQSGRKTGESAGGGNGRKR